MIIQSRGHFAEIAAPTNPFPGLRPFEFDESHLFFGRDGQSEQLIGKLARTRFLAVVGSSGSGKSSLVRAGLLPTLLGGFMTSAGSEWRIAILRPGNDPIGNLARALNATDVFGSEIEENAAMQNAITDANLRRGSRGLVEAVRQNAMPDNENLLVLVDQFEELFRFAREASRKTKEASERYQNDAAAFVKLLLEAHIQREANIYIVLTMRSDFLGDCAQFWDLPETVNESQYLTPRLTRDQLREAITGPVAVGGGEITQRLVNRLLNDVGDNQDQLPVLQHLLMRAWDEWKEKRLEVEVKERERTVRRPHKEVHEGEAIDLCCYEAVGGMAEALSRHADEAFNELPDDRHREVAEKLFKALTEKGPDNREIRRPIMLGEICAVTLAPIAEVVTVVDTFRLPGRSFLMPPAGVALNCESLIDISHESLIRGWARLKNWVEEEARSARIYRRLAETAELHREGRAGLWGDPDLQLALDWRAKNAPNKDWAQRYYRGFETAIGFLQASEQKRADDIAERERQQREAAERTRRELAQAQALAEAEQQRAEAEREKVVEQQQRLEDQARATSRLRRLMGALVVVVLLAITAALFAFASQRTAKHESERANGQAQLAKERADALNGTLGQLNTAKNKADTDKIEADRLRDSALFATVIAKREKRGAERARLFAEGQKKLAIKNAHIAEQQTRIAFARQLAAQSEKVLSTSMESLETSALLAIEAVRQSTADGGQALRKALCLLARPVESKHYDRSQQGPTFSSDGRVVATVSNYNAVSVRDSATSEPIARPLPHQGAVTALAFSGDGKYLATAEAGSVRVWETATSKPVRQFVELKDATVSAIALSPDGSRLAVGSSTADATTLQLWDVSAGPVWEPIPQPTGVEAIVFRPDGRYLVTGSSIAGRNNTGRFIARIWDSATGQPVGPPIPHGLFGQDLDEAAIAFSTDGDYIATMTNKVGARVWRLEIDELGTKNVTGYHEFARIPASEKSGNSFLAFVEDSSAVDSCGVHYYLASASGKTAQVWRLKNTNECTGFQDRFEEAVRVSLGSPVRSLTISPEGRLRTASEDGTVTLWEATGGEAVATTPEACLRINRNLSYPEWQEYMGDVPYRRTCESLPVHPSFNEAGKEMAKAGDLQGAANIYRVLTKLAPELKVNPETEPSRIAALDKGEKLLEEANRLIEEDDEEKSPTEKERKTKQVIAAYNEAAASYRRALSLGPTPELESKSGFFSESCRLGSLRGYEASVMDFCEWCVNSAPKDWRNRDSRGLARALVGNIKGAIEDFQECVDRTDDEEIRLQRKRWIEALRVGKNPFTPEELKKLRDH